MDYHRYQPTTRVTTGLTPTCRLSVWLAGYMGYPQGWSLCGVIGLTAMVHPWQRWAAYFIDSLVEGRGHCERAVYRSIERARSWV